MRKSSKKPQAEIVVSGEAVELATGRTVNAGDTLPTSDAPAEPTKADALAKATSERVERIGAARAIASTVYNGASLAVHASNRNPKALACIARVASPIQRATSPTERDLSALKTAKAHITESGTIEPSTYGADLGTLSRLASLGLLAIGPSGDIVITERGLATSC